MQSTQNSPVPPLLSNLPHQTSLLALACERFQFRRLSTTFRVQNPSPSHHRGTNGYLKIAVELLGKEILEIQLTFVRLPKQPLL